MYYTLLRAEINDVQDVARRFCLRWSRVHLIKSMISYENVFISFSNLLIRNNFEIFEKCESGSCINYIKTNYFEQMNYDKGDSIWQKARVN